MEEAREPVWQLKVSVPQARHLRAWKTTTRVEVDDLEGVSGGVSGAGSASVSASASASAADTKQSGGTGGEREQKGGDDGGEGAEAEAPNRVRSGFTEDAQYAFVSEQQVRRSDAFLTRLCNLPLVLRVDEYRADFDQRLESPKQQQRRRREQQRHQHPHKRTGGDADDEQPELSDADKGIETLGTVSIDLFPLLRRSGLRKVEGWFPVDLDTTHSRFLEIPAALAPSKSPRRGRRAGERPDSSRSRSRSKDNREKGDKKEKESTTAAEEAEANATPPKPEIYVCVEFDRPLLSEEEASESCIATVSVNSLHSLPDSWLADADRVEALEEQIRLADEAEAMKKAGRRGAAAAAAAAAGGSSGAGKGTPRRKRGDPSPQDLLAELGTRSYKVCCALPLIAGPREGEGQEIGGECETLTTPVSTLQLPDPASVAAAAVASDPLLGGDSAAAVAPPPPSSGRRSVAEKQMAKARKKAEEEALARETARQAALRDRDLALRKKHRSADVNRSQRIFMSKAARARLLAQLQREDDTGFLFDLTVSRASLLPAPVAENHDESHSHRHSRRRAADTSDRVVLPPVPLWDTLLARGQLSLKQLRYPGTASVAIDVPLHADEDSARAHARERVRVEEERAELVREATVAKERKQSSSRASKKRSAAAEEKEAKDGEEGATDATGEDAQLDVGPDVFLQSRSFVNVVVSLSRPLLPPARPVHLRPHDVLPSVTAPPVAWPSPRVEFSQKIKAAVDRLVDVYRDVQAAEAAAAGDYSEDDWKQRQQRLTAGMLFALNSSGQGRVLRELLKPVVVKMFLEQNPQLDSERFGAAALTASPSEQRLAQLRSTFFELLSKDAHRAINAAYATAAAPPDRLLANVSVRSTEGTDPALRGDFTPGQLLMLAEQAELQRDWPRAHQLHRNRCIVLQARLDGIWSRRAAQQAASAGRSSSNRRLSADLALVRECADSFHAHALCSLRQVGQGPVAEAQRARSQAVQCLQAAIAVDCDHVPSLLVYTCLLSEAGQLKQSWPFLEALLTLAGPNERPLALLLYSFYLSWAEEDEDSEHALRCAVASFFQEQAPAQPPRGTRLLALSLARARELEIGVTGGEEEGGEEKDAKGQRDDWLGAAAAGDEKKAARGSRDAHCCPALDLFSVTLLRDSVAVMQMDPVARRRAEAATAAPNSSSSSSPTSSLSPVRKLLSRFGGSIFTHTASTLISLACPDLAERMLALDRSGLPACAHPWRALQEARLLWLRTASAQESTDTEALVAAVEPAVRRAAELCVDSGELVEVSALLGHLFFVDAERRGDERSSREARAAYQCYLDWEPEQCDPLLLLRMGRLHASVRDWSRARDCFLMLCQQQPCALSWLHAGVASLQLGALDSARRALVRANLLDNTDADVWAQLCLLSLRRSEDVGKVSLSLVQAVELGCQDDVVFCDIGSLLLRKGNYQLAERALTHALRVQETAEAHLLLGHVLGALGFAEPQSAHYRAALAMAAGDGGAAAEAQIQRAIGEQRQRLQQLASDQRSAEASESARVARVLVGGSGDAGLLPRVFVPASPSAGDSLEQACRRAAQLPYHVSVVQYNVLADAYCNGSSRGFPYAPAAALEWVHRRQLHLQFVDSVAGDVLCLEEVDHFVDFWQPEMNKRGYDGVFAKATEAAVHGLALFWRTARVARLALEECRFGEKHTFARGQLALIATFRLTSRKEEKKKSQGQLGEEKKQRDSEAEEEQEGKGEDDDDDNDDDDDEEEGMSIAALNARKVRVFCVAVTHLRAKHGNEHLRLAQGDELLARVARVSSVLKDPEDRDDDEDAPRVRLPIIIAGDFNDHPGSLVHSLFSHGRGVHGPADEKEEEKKKKKKDKGEAALDCRSQLELRSVYPEQPCDQPAALRANASGGEPIWTTMKQRHPVLVTRRMIDYLWYSPAGVVPVSYMPMPQDEHVPAVGFPSMDWPSDHLAVAARFRFT